MNVNIPEGVLHSLSVVLITLILSYFTLVFGELVPKQIGMRKAESIALGLASLINVIAKIFAPIVWFLTLSTNTVLKILGIDPNEEDEQDSEEEIRMMVDVGSEKGTIDLDEKEFIQNIFEFDDLIAEDILTHRTDIVMLDINDSVEKWHHIIVNHSFTLYPICDEGVDHIIGVLNSKEYFRLPSFEKEMIMEKAVHPAYFVLNTINADVLFKNMKKEKQSIAIVLDEYGGVSGIVTIHDLVEQLVGNLEDDEKPLIQEIEEGVWHIHGSAFIEDIAEKLNISLPEQEFETLNGLIFHALENVPKKGKDISLEINNLKIHIETINDYQVENAIVRIKE